MYILFEPKKAQTRRKHEKKTKKTRKIDAILRVLRLNKGENHRAKTAR